MAIHSSMENPMERGVRWAIIHRVAKSWTRMKQQSMYTHIICLYTNISDRVYKNRQQLTEESRWFTYRHQKNFY